MRKNRKKTIILIGIAVTLLLLIVGFWFYREFVSSPGKYDIYDRLYIKPGDYKGGYPNQF